MRINLLVDFVNLYAICSIGVCNPATCLLYICLKIPNFHAETAHALTKLHAYSILN